MSDYLKFANQLGLANTTEQRAIFDIVGSLYDKFDALNLGISYENFIEQSGINDIIDSEVSIEDLEMFNDLVEAIQAEQTQRKQEEKEALFAKFAFEQSISQRFKELDTLETLKPVTKQHSINKNVEQVTEQRKVERVKELEELTKKTT